MATKKETPKKVVVRKTKEAESSEKRIKKELTSEEGQSMKYFSGIGRRKSATAAVRIFEHSDDGEADVSVNGKSAKEYFPTIRLQNLLLDPIRAIGMENKFRISVHVHGGGPSGQAGASGLGLARALVVANPGHRALLKAGKFLTRDARKVERKKPGLNKARRAPQWSKR